jgi:hypothetical protein
MWQVYRLSDGMVLGTFTSRTQAATYCRMLVPNSIHKRVLSLGIKQVQSKP